MFGGIRRLTGNPFEMLDVGDCPTGDAELPFCRRCWCNARALAIALFSTEALLFPAKLKDGCTGRLAMPKTPIGVEFGFILRGSETDRRDGTLRGGSLGLSWLGDSSGVVGSDESSEPGDPGVERSFQSSGVAGTESEADIEYYGALIVTR